MPHNVCNFAQRIRLQCPEAERQHRTKLLTVNVPLPGLPSRAVAGWPITHAFAYLVRCADVRTWVNDHDPTSDEVHVRAMKRAFSIFITTPMRQ